MGNFLSTLPELGESLWRVILLNGGVKLAATPRKSTGQSEGSGKRGDGRPRLRNLP